MSGGSAPNGDVRQFTGWHMLAIMVAFFSTIIAVNFTMAWFASKSWTGLVVANGYVASQHFNESLEAARRQKALGWKTDISYESGKLEVQLLDRYGNPVVLDFMKVAVGRPSDEDEDRSLDLVHSGHGLYAVQADLAGGQWAAQFTGKLNDEPWRIDTRFLITGDGTGKMQ